MICSFLELSCFSIFNKYVILNWVKEIEALCVCFFISYPIYPAHCPAYRTHVKNTHNRENSKWRTRVQVKMEDTQRMPEPRKPELKLQLKP